MSQVQLNLLQGGFCSHSEKMVLRTRGRAPIAFPSMFALIQHPIQGALLFDTGYSSHFFSATQPFPERLYRMVTPVTLTSRETAKVQLQQFGIQAEDIRYILISHFHGDHVAGLRDFPRARFVFLEQGYQTVKQLKKFQAVRIGYLADLLPADFESRVWPLASDSPTICQAPAPFAKAFDLFGDQSIFLIPLEGHFCGQMGALINSQKGPVFLIADACWLRQSFERLELPHPIAMSIMHNAGQYKQDLKDIQHYAQTHPGTLIVPSHCTESIRRFQDLKASSIS